MVHKLPKMQIKCKSEQRMKKKLNSKNKGIKRINVKKELERFEADKKACPINCGNICPFLQKRKKRINEERWKE